LYTAVVVIHVIVCIGLVIAILLHSGKGAGLSASFGGDVSGFSGSTMIEKNLDRITIGMAVVFTITSLLLAFIL